MKRFFKNIKNKSQKPIVIVSGLPRSGTSMMMKMLDIGGIPPLKDDIRVADGNNPKGYYELERVKKLKGGDYGWLPDARGMAVKVIGALLIELPEGFKYKVLFMRRKMEEIITSQNKMLENRGEEVKVDDQVMATLFQKHIRQIEAWMKNQPDLFYIDVDYNQMLKDPLPQLFLINKFLGNKLNVEEMVDVIDTNLYRQKQ